MAWLHGGTCSRGPVGSGLIAISAGGKPAWPMTHRFATIFRKAIAVPSLAVGAEPPFYK